MAQALRRILRFRQLAEEQARFEVERAAQLLRRTTAAWEQQVAIEHRQRTTLAESWTPRQTNRTQSMETPSHDSTTVPGENMEEGDWLMEEAVLEFLGWKRMRLEQLQREESRRIEPLIERYTECRRELRQTEQLLEQQANIEAVEQGRRAQAEMDEWFLQRGRMRRRKAEQRENDRRKRETSQK